MESINSSNIVRGSAYFILHQDQFCEHHLLGSYTILRQECKCRIDQPIPIERKEGFRAKSVSFYATDGTLLKSMKLDDTSNDLNKQTTDMLDPSVRFVATGIYIGPFMKGFTSIFVNFNIGEKKDSKHISFFEVNGRTKEQILAWVKEKQSITSRFDISGISVHNITIYEQPNKPCWIL
ncbi:MAG: hypothetical protein Dasosvirus3_11 [Dasosvirus sp.]|uniref:Uncharacterized protein n=1 Tax=Dasosvirus sp. TaxID=2487764 RepID=A0A3G4ZRB5_9VIRU|nr:MAG: hypothetical protein Dasosvirus3_11 [Dasosvirus sp.]